MRLSLWQRFSSNHSADFTLVGVFKTPAEAEAVAARLRALWHDIVTWRTEAGQIDADGRWDGYTFDPTPPEQAMAQTLGIEWGSVPLDWGWVAADDPAVVTTLDQWLFIDGRDSSAGAKVTEKLVAALGGQPVVAGQVVHYPYEPGSQSEMRLRLTAQVADAVVGQAVAQAVQQDWPEVKVDLSQLPEHQIQFELEDFSGRRVELAALRVHLQARGFSAITVEFSDVRSSLSKTD